MNKLEPISGFPIIQFHYFFFFFHFNYLSGSAPGSRTHWHLLHGFIGGFLFLKKIILTWEVDALAADLVLRVGNRQDALEDGLLRQDPIGHHPVQCHVEQTPRSVIHHQILVVKAFDHFPVKNQKKKKLKKVRKTVVSVEAQTRTNQAKITVPWRSEKKTVLKLL